MPAAKPPQQLRAQRTRHSLLDAARRVFAQDGYERATVDDVVRAAGCSKGAYYFHFASKEEALLALLDDWIARRSQQLAAADGAGAPEAALSDVLEALLSSPAADASEQRLVLEFWRQAARNPRVGRRLAAARRSWLRLLVRAFRRAQEAGLLSAGLAAQPAAQVALALHDGLALQACLRAETRAEAKSRAAAALELLAGPTALRRAG